MMKKSMFTKIVVLIIVFTVFQAIKMTMINKFNILYGVEHIEIYFKEEINYELLKIKKGYDELYPIANSKQHCTINANVDIDIDGVGTNCRMGEVKPLDMVDGAFWGEQSDLENRNVVVISDSLAILLFNTIQAKGKMCMINDTPYRVIGVYKYQDTLEEVFFGTGEETIYFPITSNLGKANSVSNLIIRQLQGKSIDQILGQLGLHKEDCIIYDGTNKTKCLDGLFRFSEVLLLWIFLIESLDIFYLKDWNKKKVVFIGLIFCVDALILKYLTREIYIVPGFLPPYNIFDISHYINYFKQSIRLHNQMRSFSCTYFEQTYWLYSQWSTVLTIIQGIISIIICKKIKKNMMCMLDYMKNSL